MHTVKRSFYLKDYKILLEFNDGKIKIVDLEQRVKKGKGVFVPLKKKTYFQQVTIDDPEYPSTVCWPNGADICPDTLYEMGVELEEIV